MSDAQTVIAVIAIAILVALIVVRLLVGRIPIRLPRRQRTQRIAVVGIGGAGGNAVDAMVRAKIRGGESIACNTDAQALRRSLARRKVQIGRSTTGGLGSGGDPAVGRRAAEEDASRLRRAIRGADLVFVIAGLGGGTGSGAAPLVGEIARASGALTIGLVTLPFAFEGETRARIAAKAAADLRMAVDTLITIPNDRLSTVTPENASLLDAFQAADEVLCGAVAAMSEIITVPGLVNLDFADLRNALANGGPAVFGLGRAGGDERATAAADQALTSPLLEPGMAGARSIVFHIGGPKDLRLAEVKRVAEAFRASADPGVNLVFGATIDRRRGDEVRVTLIATGIEHIPIDDRRAAVDVPAPAADVPGTPDPTVQAPAARRRARGRTRSTPAVPAGPTADPVAPIADPAGATDDPEPASEGEEAGVRPDAAGASADELDIPTFLRSARRAQEAAGASADGADDAHPAGS